MLKVRWCFYIKTISFLVTTFRINWNILSWNSWTEKKHFQKSLSVNTSHKDETICEHDSETLFFWPKHTSKAFMSGGMGGVLVPIQLAHLEREQSF